MSRGLFITLEGGEGAGKSTQVALLAQALEATGIKVLTTREPGGSKGAEDIRKLLVEGEIGRWTPMAETLLLLAARADHLTRKIRPALEEGAWVICDRFADSTIAYQGVGLGLGIDVVQSLSDMVLGDIRPDLTLILDLGVETGLARAGKRQGDDHRYERMGEDFHHRLRQGFRDIAEREPGRCAVLDAEGSVANIHRDILAAIADRLKVDLIPAPSPEGS